MKLDRDIEEFVAKGSQPDENWIVTTIRLPKWLLDDIDKLRAKRLGINRNTWFLESLQEKIKKDSNVG